MTRLEENRQLYEFNAWAARRTFESTAALGVDEFTRDLKNSFPSVRETLIHIVGGEWVWLARWKGTSPTAFPNADALRSNADVARFWQDIDAERNVWLSTLNESSLDTVISYRSFAGVDFSFPLWQMLRHLVNHSSYHRGQIATMLRQLGYSPVATDLIRMYQEQQQAAASIRV